MGDSSRSRKKICKHCRQKLLKEYPHPASASEDETTMFMNNDERFVTPKKSIGRVNNVLSELNLTPIQENKKMSKKRRLNMIQQVTDKISGRVSEELLMACDVDKEEDQGSLADITLGDYAQFLNELKEKCDSATTFIEKIKYLTAVPASWSLNKTRDFF